MWLGAGALDLVEPAATWNSLTVFFDRNSVTATLHIYAMNGIAFLSKHKTEYHLTLLDALNSPQVKPQIPEPGAGMRNLLTEMGNGYR